VPEGTAVVLNPPNPSTEFVWSAASVAAGTEIVFVMTDSQNRTGGASGIIVSGSTGDTSCLNSNSPSVTLQGTSSTMGSSSAYTSSAYTSSTYTSPTSSPSSTPGSSSSKVTLAAAIAGASVGLVALVALGVFLSRRYRGSGSRRQRRDFDLDGESQMYLLSHSLR
jgi:hypothetical protein